MISKLLCQFPKSRYLFYFIFLITFTQANTQIGCGHIEGLEFTNGHESSVLVDGGTYVSEDLPNNFFISMHVDGHSQSARYVVENLDTGAIYRITENILPYTFPAGNHAWNLGDGNYKLTASLYRFDLGIGHCDTKIITFTLGDICKADAGTFRGVSGSVNGGLGSIEAIPNDDVVVPDGYSKIFVLTSGEDLVIEQVNGTPSFIVEESGKYTVHTLVYDSRPESLNFLDLNVVVFGETTGGDVLSIVTANNLCASLDVTGVSVTLDFCTADAGTITADADTVVLTGGSATISATPDGNINVPANYSQIFVLTSGTGLVIESVSATPEFTVEGSGLYTIHTLVYDAREESANYLDLGIVELGVTTGVDVLTIVGEAGICASLDAAGAPVTVEDCTADAGTITADADTVVLTGGSATISATPDGNINVPANYSQIFVLTSGTGLVIENVSATPEFTVESSGLYTIHTLVYDAREDSANYLDLGIVEIGVTTGVDVLTIVGEAGICASLDAAGAPVTVEDCTADAGTITADADTVVLTGGSATISAHPDGNINVPANYSQIFVLTSGTGLVIESVSATPEFTVEGSGLYTIHTLVYDAREDSANYLDLGIVEIGVTTGVDVLTIVGEAGICASLDAAGAPVTVEDCTADAGTITADADTVVLTGGSATISATPDGNINVPANYSQIFVLTSGTGLVIESVSATPEFTVEGSGLYTIHTLVYDAREDSANYLDLGIVELGVTTGVDVLAIVGEAGICASLDAAGAPVTVEDCTADAGTITADADTVVLTGGSATISAHPDGNINVPANYSQIFVLTSGTGLVIESVSATPEFTVESSGLYTIHTLVYDARDDSANYLDLGIVELGVTTGVDVLTIVGEAGICASLDAAGAPVTVEDCTADAGTITADAATVVLTGGSATISATPDGNINVPTDYSQIFVLTSGTSLVIENVSATPEFTVEGSGLYTIHTLVYDAREDSANYLDLGIVELGVTTGVDVLNLVGATGICASLDATGAPVTVEESEECIAFSGKMYSKNPISCLDKGIATISAKTSRKAIIPNGYQRLYVLTEAYSLTILNVSETPSFEVSHKGFYRIHSLVYNPETLDLSVVVPGQTTGFDVVNLIKDNNICASLDVRGAVNLVIGSKWFCYFFNKYYGGGNSGKSSELAKGGNDGSLEGFVNNYSSYQEFKNDFIAQNSKSKFFPNPVTNNLNVELELIEDEIMNFNIIDVSGRSVMSGVASDLEFGLQKINAGRLNSGMYLVQFVSEYRTITKKIIVKK
ncbi:T9SS type A sorting domain-containing protein [uncultured Algibacter sp.]|uniref:T9SS type A sorting domain-containing protein n=1 Tax=uncultured Algibacter sp. TaxID=298659 RepID=UPI0026235D25|nr:T9SS type A sorting domain-containing protein [uncultured Algibacter sp.]